MFHLQAGVHLQKIKLLLLLIVNKLHCARVAVIHRRHQAGGGFMEGVANRLRQIRCRRFLKHLLIATLGRTIPFPQGQCLAFAVAKNLHLNMTGLLDVFFNKHTVVTEVVGTQALHTGKRLL